MVVDRANDKASGSPQGTDLTALYALADVSNLYLAIRTMGDEPNTEATFTAGFRTESGTFHATVNRNGTECLCFQQPWVEGGIYHRCAFSVGEIAEMRLPLGPLGSPESTDLTNVWVWREEPSFDSYDGRPVEIPNLRSFLNIQTATLQTVSATSCSAVTVTAVRGTVLDQSWALLAAVMCILMVLGICNYLRGTEEEKGQLYESTVWSIKKDPFKVCGGPGGI